MPLKASDKPHIAVVLRFSTYHLGVHVAIDDLSGVIVFICTSAGHSHDRYVYACESNKHGKVR